MMWKLQIIYGLSPWSVKQNPEFTDHCIILGMVLVQPAAGYFNNTILALLYCSPVQLAPYPKRVLFHA